MRIVAGEFRGRAIAAPDGQGTRPTTDRVREALFSSLYSRIGGFDGAVVLDAFAGSGALALEALSRGASFALFIENDRAAAAAVRANMKACGIGSDRASLVQRDALSLTPACPRGAFGLVFLDPPYAYDAADVLAAVTRWVELGAVERDAIIVYEHAVTARDELTEAAAQCGFEVVAQKKYGKTGVTTLQPADIDAGDNDRSIA